MSPQSSPVGITEKSLSGGYKSPCDVRQVTDRIWVLERKKLPDISRFSWGAVWSNRRIRAYFEDAVIHPALPQGRGCTGRGLVTTVGDLWRLQR